MFKDSFGVTGDDDFLGHQSADPALVRAFKEGLVNLDQEDLHFDMREGPDSDWNGAVMDILVRKLEKASKTSGYKLPSRSKAYYLDLVRDRYKRARAAWRRAQPRTTDMDVLESPKEVESRLVASKDHQLATARSRERRVAVSGQLMQ